MAVSLGRWKPRGLQGRPIPQKPRLPPTRKGSSGRQVCGAHCRPNPTGPSPCGADCARDKCHSQRGLGCPGLTLRASSRRPHTSAHSKRHAPRNHGMPCVCPGSMHVRKGSCMHVRRRQGHGLEAWSKENAARTPCAGAFP
eukprot:5316216-Alexandrium_andersonii.AAC.1